jgi:sortase A
METLASGEPARPWPWADTWPVARLRFPTLKRDLPVLAGASGATLAFGPGHLDGTAAPGALGHSVIAGHRDTSFTFLGSLRQGDPVAVQRQDGSWRDYRVTGTAIADARLPWQGPAQAKGIAALTLVTCWPLDSIVPGGPLRYLVFAEEFLSR